MGGSLSPSPNRTSDHFTSGHGRRGAPSKEVAANALRFHSAGDLLQGIVSETPSQLLRFGAVARLDGFPFTLYTVRASSPNPQTTPDHQRVILSSMSTRAPKASTGAFLSSRFTLDRTAALGLHHPEQAEKKGARSTLGFLP